MCVRVCEFVLLPMNMCHDALNSHSDAWHSRIIVSGGRDTQAEAGRTITLRYSENVSQHSKTHSSIVIVFYECLISFGLLLLPHSECMTNSATSLSIYDFQRRRVCLRARANVLSSHSINLRLHTVYGSNDNFFFFPSNYSQNELVLLLCDHSKLNTVAARSSGTHQSHHVRSKIDT